MSGFTIKVGANSSDDDCQDVPTFSFDNLQDKNNPSKRGSKFYEYRGRFTNRDAALVRVHRETARHRRIRAYDTDAGRVEYYGCCESLRCPKIWKLLFHISKSGVSLFEGDDEHRHGPTGRTQRGIAHHIREEIKNLFHSDIVRPTTIKTMLELKGVKPLPTLLQVQSFVQLHRHHQKERKIDIQQLEKFCQEHSQVPEDEDDAFCIGMEIRAYRQCGNDASVPLSGHVRFMFSTPRLLRQGCLSSNVHADTTCKLLWRGMHIIIVGITDKKRQFHPLGIGVCSTQEAPDFHFVFRVIADGVRQITGINWCPRILIGNSDEAMTDGFQAAVGSGFSRVHCWMHCLRTVIKTMRSFVEDKHLREQLRSDIAALQLSLTQQHVACGMQLLVTKYENIPCVSDFLGYFLKEWIHQRSNWYEGYCIGVPSTNDALVTFVRRIVKEQKLQERLSVHKYLQSLLSSIRSWSVERNAGSHDSVAFSSVPEIDLTNWEKAISFVRERRRVLKFSGVGEESELTVHYVGSAEHGPLTDEQLLLSLQKQRNCEFIDFTDFTETRNSFWAIELNSQTPLLTRCTCPFWLRNFKCKHSLGLALKLRILADPAETVNLNSEPQSRRRPPKAK